MVPRWGFFVYGHWAPLRVLWGLWLIFVSCARYEKEFDKVNDVFELQVRFSPALYLVSGLLGLGAGKWIQRAFWG